MRPADPTHRALVSYASFLLLCTLLLLSFSARAQSPSAYAEQSAESDTCLQDPKCIELYESARSLSQAGQYEAALVAYQSAYARSKAAWLLVNVGRIYQKASRPQQAVATYKRLLADPAADAQTQSKAREYLLQAEQEVQAQKVAQVPADASQASKPVYKKWWFWTILGGTAAVAVAVGLGVGLTPRSPSVPQGVSVYDTGF